MSEQPFFVYELIDPRCGSVFYVGKGKGSRPFQHEKQARKGSPGRKCERIRDIIDSGKVPTVRIVKRFSDELEAYAEEAFHIAIIGIGNLTNVCIGGVGAVTQADPTAEARKAIKSNLRSMRKALAIAFSGLSVGVAGYDITDVVRSFVKDMRAKAGKDWFDNVVGVPQWQPA